MKITKEQEMNVTAWLTQERLQELLIYIPYTGDFIWRVNRGSNKLKGKIAGNFTGSRSIDYRMISVDGINHMAHRLAWLYVHGEFPKVDIDHINGDGLDNRLINLRSVSRADNSKNQKKTARNKSGVVGVSWYKKSNKWISQLSNTVNGKRNNVYLGLFEEMWDAICARKSADNKYGYHVNHGRRA